MLKIIIVPIDVSAKADIGPTLDIAKTLSDQYSGRLVLLNVAELPPSYVEAYYVDNYSRADMEKRAKESAEAKLKELAANNNLPENTQMVVKYGPAARKILDYANEIGADLIVINSHDPDLTDYLLGSVAARVVRHAHCSVLVTRRLQG